MRAGDIEDDTATEVPAEPAADAEASGVEERTSVSCAGLKSHHCRWVLDDPRHPAPYCGGPRLKQFPYCKEHALRAYGSLSVPVRGWS